MTRLLYPVSVYKSFSDLDLRLDEYLPQDYVLVEIPMIDQISNTIG
jgi:hypothetical protein